MTEPNVASSDAANIETRLTRIEERGSGDVSYLLNGEKWWSTGAMDPRCAFALVLAKMDYSRCGGISKEKISKKGEKRKSGSGRHGAHTVALIPSSAIEPIRPLTVFGYDDAPHGHAHIILRDIHIQPSSLILGEGRGFEIAQSRLGPGRIHHCMRAVGLASRCYELMLVRTMERETFGKKLCEHGGCQEMIADSANDLEAAGLLTLSCAAEIDARGADGARARIAGIKVAVPDLCFRVVDRAVQIFGGAGVDGNLPLAKALAGLRTLRIADGPDAVHRRTLARVEIIKARKTLGVHSTNERVGSTSRL